MDEVRLYLDGILVDLNEKADIKLTYQINDFADISNRNASSSFKFDLPKTDTNVRLFNFLGSLGDTSNSQNRYSTADLYRNGIPIVLKGKAKISDTDFKKGNYKINLVSENFNLKDQLQDKKISEIDFSAINHVLTEDTYFNSFKHNWTNGYIYALCDNGFLDTDNININYQVPMLFYKWIFNEILAINGFTYEYVGVDNIFESSDFNDLVISLDRGFDENDPLVPLQEVSTHEATNNRSVSIISNATQIDKDGILFKAVVDPFTIGTTANSIYGTETIFRVLENNYYRFDLTGAINVANSENLKLTIEINGLEFMIIADDITGTLNLNFSDRFYLRTTDEVKIFFTGQTVESGNAQIINYNYSLDLSINIDESSKVINFSSFFTDIKQIDFIKDFTQHFGLLYQIRKGSNNIEFLKIEELFNDLNNFVDWTDKFDFKKKEKYEIGNYARRNVIKYNYDNEDIIFANGRIDIENPTLESEKTLFTRIFNAPTLSSTKFSNQLIWKTSLYTVDFNDDGTVKVIKPSEQRPYLFKLKNSFGTINYSLDGGSITTKYGAIKLASFDGISGQELINNNYLTFKELLKRQRLVTISALIEDLDVYNLDFLKLYYFKQEQRYYYLNKLNYKGSRLTDIEVIPVPQVERLGEYNDDYNNDYNI